MEKGARGPPFSRPSAAASFMGWYLAAWTPEESPDSITAPVPTRPTIAPMSMLFRANSFSRPFSRYQPLTATTKTPPVTQPLVTLWKNLETATGFETTSQNAWADAISLRTVSGLKVVPTGFCIQPFATRIQYAEMVAPMPVSQVDARWNRLETLFQPKNITAKKVASMKKARMPSMASGAPNMSPTNQE